MKYLNRIKSQTPESVELEFILAGVGNRTHAFIIDYVLWLCALFALLIIWAVLFAQFEWLRSPTIRPWFMAIQYLLIFFVYIGYFVGFETWWRGQTPGKRRVNIRVIRDDGRNVGLQQSILRSLLRPIDDLLGLGLLFIIFSKQEKRLGDLVAGTICIQEGQAVATDRMTLSPAATELSERLITTGKIAALTPEEFATIRTYLYRYPTLAPDAKNQLSYSLAGKLLKRLELDEAAPTRDSHLAIEAIYLAYQQQFRG